MTNDEILSHGRRWLRSASAAVVLVAVLGAMAAPAAAASQPALGPKELAILGALALGSLFILAIVSANLVARRRRRRIDLLARAEIAQVLAASLQHMSNGLVLIDAQMRIRACNDRVRALFGLAPEEAAAGMELAVFLGHIGARHGWDAAKLGRVIDNHALWMADAEVKRIEQNMEDGRILDIHCRPIADGGAILTYDDVTEERRLQSRLEAMAYADALTGLANRRRFTDQVIEAPDGARYAQALILDLDRFKPINDMFGHASGDALLVEVAERLRAVCRPQDLIFRLGGDEFAILPVPPLAEGLDRLAAQVLAELNRPFRVGGQMAHIGCSIGFVEARADIEPETLMKKADLALYRAKQGGRGRAARYSEGMIEESAQRRQTEVDLARAIEREQFELHYQPIHALPTLRLLGFEALIRWRHPERGLVSPAEFIPLAEECGLIPEIGDWVLETAVRQMARWPAEIRVAVNVSPAQLCNADVVFGLDRLLAHTGVAPGRLELELTETALVRDAGQIARTLQDLRGLGVGIAMDDFGTGYSSLTHLLAFEMDRIKIDRSFIDAAAEDPRARAVLRAVISMANDMEVETVGEGVETEAQLSALIALGCSAAQGYFLGRPMETEQAGVLIHREAFALDAAHEREVAVLRAAGARRAAGGDG